MNGIYDFHFKEFYASSVSIPANNQADGPTPINHIRNKNTSQCTKTDELKSLQLYEQSVKIELEYLLDHFVNTSTSFLDLSVIL